MSKLPRLSLLVLTSALVALPAAGLLILANPQGSLFATPAFAQKAKKKPAAAPVQAYSINDDVDDPAVWGQVFPLQYELYLKTVDMSRTKFGGSEAVPRTPTEADPRSMVVAEARSKTTSASKPCGRAMPLPWIIRQRRGHAYMLEDQTFTQRQAVVAQPGTCMNCHASNYVAFKKAGDGDIIKGFEKINIDALQGSRQAGEASGFLHRLP